MSADADTSSDSIKKKESKVFNDPIHGSVELHPLLIKIIDTPQFQRLRYIKQLGGAYLVYPGASHNRFEHSIGVAHLAGELAKALQTRQPKLKITDRDILCVQIAGLCHDLGHGPFSHLFDQMFIPMTRPPGDKTEKWTHEEASKEMFDHMVKSNDREDEPEDKMEVMMKKSGLKLPKDIDFIKEMIAGRPKRDQGQEVLPNDADFIKGVIAGPTKAAQGQEVLGINTAHVNCVKSVSSSLLEQPMSNATVVLSSPQWPYKGRKKEKSFLYEIVANKRNGIDVDKFDYLARDCYYLGIQNNFDYRRFLKFVRVCEVDREKHEVDGEKHEVDGEKHEVDREKHEVDREKHEVDGEKQICTRDKEEGNLYDMFHTRYCLHRRVCQHRVNTIIQHMIAEAFLKADKHIEIEGSGGEMFTLSTAICDMVAYTKLTDHVFEQILNCPETSSPELKEAREILKKITNRRLYKFLGQTKANDTDVTQQKEMWKKELELPEGDGLTDDFVVVDSIMDYGMKDENPIDEMRFYKKEEPDRAFKILRDEKSMFLPVCYSEKLIRVYYRKIDDESMEAARKHFNNVEQKLCPKPQAARDTVTPELTPGENVENDLSD